MTFGLLRQVYEKIANIGKQTLHKESEEFNMKKITAIVRQEKLEVLKDALFAADVRGMTINQVQGCGAQHGWKEYVRGNELLVNTIPKVQFTLICADEHVDGIVEIICNAARTGAVGDGKIWVEPVEEVIRIRTGEHGPAAV